MITSGRSSYYYITIIIFILFLILLLLSLKNYWKYSKFLLSKFGYILIWWKFNNWKTRLLAQIWETAIKFNKFVISNFYYWKAFLNFSSKKDFLLLVSDLLFLWELQNYNDEEFNLYYKNYPEEWRKAMLNKRKEFRKKFKYIPFNWYVCNFILLGDEFHQYFTNREAMSNFTGENKRFLTSLHQVRHFNTLMALATQDIEDLDLKFRKLASYEIDTLHYWNLFFGYNLYKYNHKRNENDKEFSKINKLPIIKLNNYSINILYKKIEKWLNNKRFIKAITKEKIEFKRLNELPFNTKFNVDVSISIYEEGDLFIKLNEFFKQDFKNSDKYLNID